MQVRNDVNKALESYRADGKIGSALDAEIILHADQSAYEKLSMLQNELRFLLITSDARVVKTDNSGDSMQIEIRVSEQEKCVRCWQRRPDVNADSAHAGLCMRCVDNIAGSGEARVFA